MSLQTTGASAISTPFESVFATIGTEVTLADSTKVQAIEVRPHENRVFDLTNVDEMIAYNMRANNALLAEQTTGKTTFAPMTARVNQAQAAISEWRRSLDYSGVAGFIFGSRFNEQAALLSTASKFVALKYHATRDTLIKTFNTSPSGGAVSGGSILVNTLSVGAAIASMQDLVTILGPELYQGRVADETRQLVFEMFKREREAHNKDIMIKTDPVKSLYGSADPATFWREMSTLYNVKTTKAEAAVRQNTADTIATLCSNDPDLKKMCADFVRSLEAVAPHLPGFESAHGNNDVMIFSVVMQSLAENGALLRGDRLSKGEYSTQELVDTLVDVAGYRTFDDPHRQKAYENALADLFAAFGVWSGYTPQARETSEMTIATKAIQDGLQKAGVAYSPSVAHVTNAINAGARQLKDVDSFQNLMQTQLTNNFDQAMITMKWINSLCMLVLGGPGVLIAAYIAAKFAWKKASSPQQTSQTSKRPSTPTVQQSIDPEEFVYQPRNKSNSRVVVVDDSDYEEGQ